MSRRKILIYSGKSPEGGRDIDGGSILASQLLETLKYHNDVDLVLNRESDESFSDRFISGVKIIRGPRFFTNKFEHRIRNRYLNAKALSNYGEYDIIIVLHIALLFGLENYDETFWRRVILFPMFCTPSYKKSGESVPALYTKMEQFVIDRVNKIISPSNAEKKSLIEFYNADQQRIFVIPRGIDPAFFPSKIRNCSPNLNIVYIASIKKQKNSLCSIELLDIIRNKGIDARLHLICTVQDKKLYSDLVDMIKQKGLMTYVQFHFEISQKQEAEILRDMDINISVSKHETFGRGIFEGISTGLPTFVLSSLECVKEICGDVPGVSITDNIIEMAKDIQYVFYNPIEYARRQESLRQIAENMSYYKEQVRLREVILGDQIGALEYLGINISPSGCLLEEKRYFHYNGHDASKFSDEINSHLKPFDVGERSGNEFSISYFIKNASKSFIEKIEYYINKHYGIIVNVNGFVEKFANISRLGEAVHYDPVLSIKINNNVVTAASFYITTVINKDDCPDFWERVRKSIPIEASLKDLIDKLLFSNSVLMFQMSWDFSLTGLKHNKLYLKIKNTKSFFEIISDYFPSIQKYCKRPGFRFCEIAFVIKEAQLKHFNLYFKPL